MFTSTYYCCIEVDLADLEDNVSEWNYVFFLYLHQGERQKLGSTI
jgi:hypothetical protein